ncbi:MAG TPA: substrate-binding domain-containing protein, partial [Anaerolineaceae bacterium]
GFAYPYARGVVLDWIRENRLPQAIFTGNDDAALDVILTFHRLGIRVPEDVAVIGFDDAYLSPGVVPPLTTVHAPTREVGRTGVRVLLELLETGKAEDITLLPTELVVRRSCGCSHQVEPEAWPDINLAAFHRPGVPVGS